MFKKNQNIFFINKLENFSLTFSSYGIGLAIIGIFFLNLSRAIDSIWNLENQYQNSWGQIIFIIFGTLNFLIFLLYIFKFFTKKNNFLFSIKSNVANAILVSNCFNQLYFFSQLIVFFSSNKGLYWFGFNLFIFSHFMFLGCTIYIFIYNFKTIFNNCEFINFWYYGLITITTQVTNATNLVDNPLTIYYSIDKIILYYFFVLYIFTFLFYFLNILNIYLFIKYSKQDKTYYMVHLAFIVVSFCNLFAGSHLFYFLNKKAVGIFAFVMMVLAYICYIQLFWIVPYSIKKHGCKIHPCLPNLFITTLNASFVFINKNYDNLNFINFNVAFYVFCLFSIAGFLYITPISYAISKEMIQQLFIH